MEIRTLGEHAKLRTNRRKFRGVFLWVDRALGEAAENEIIKKFYSLGERHTPEDSERYVPFKTLGLWPMAAAAICRPFNPQSRERSPLSAALRHDGHTSAFSFNRPLKFYLKPLLRSGTEGMAFCCCLTVFAMPSRI